MLDRILNGIDRFAGSGFAPERPARVQRSREHALGAAVVGCGFVADFYARTVHEHPEIECIGVMDRDRTRAERLSARLGVHCYSSLEELLSDSRVQLVLNLTNPESHAVVSKACLVAGRHVYSEKPLAMTLGEAEELVRIAEERGLHLASAPCSILGETAQALAAAVKGGDIGHVRLAYAQLDDGPIHQMRPEEWASPEGTPWPWKDEMTVGCTLEHAGYYLSWLVAFFGEVESVTAFSTCLVPDKHPELPAGETAPDFSVSCIRFRSGMVARLTCGIFAPHDHSLQIIGDQGVLSVDECWHNAAPVRLRRFSGLGFRAETYPWMARLWPARFVFGLDGRRHPRSPKAGWRLRLRRHEMDYLLGVAELARSVREQRSCVSSARFALHVTEIVLAIQQAGETGASIRIRSTLSGEPLSGAGWSP